MTTDYLSPEMRKIVSGIPSNGNELDAKISRKNKNKLYTSVYQIPGVIDNEERFKRDVYSGMIDKGITGEPLGEGYDYKESLTLSQLLYRTSAKESLENIGAGVKKHPVVRNALEKNYVPYLANFMLKNTRNVSKMILEMSGIDVIE